MFVVDTDPLNQSAWEYNR